MDPQITVIARATRAFIGGTVRYPLTVCAGQGAEWRVPRLYLGGVFVARMVPGAAPPQ